MVPMSAVSARGDVGPSYAWIDAMQRVAAAQVQDWGRSSQVWYVCGAVRQPRVGWRQASGHAGSVTKAAGRRAAAQASRAGTPWAGAAWARRHSRWSRGVLSTRLACDPLPPRGQGF